MQKIKDEEDFDIDTETKEIRSRKDQFLQSMEKKLDLNNAQHNERFVQIKNQILEKVKTTKVSRYRSRSGSQGVKRSPSGGPLDDGRPPSRPRTHLPVPAK